MKAIGVLLAVLFLVSTGCAHAAQVTLDGTWPCYSAVPGTCSVAAPDTCKYIDTGLLWRAQRTDLSDSILVATLNGRGQYCLPFSISVNQPDGTTYYYWFLVKDVTGTRRTCRGTIVTRVVMLSPVPASLR